MRIFGGDGLPTAAFTPKLKKETALFSKTLDTDSYGVIIQITVET
jgi:hypothetical protein